MNKQEIMALVDEYRNAYATGREFLAWEIRAAIESALPDVPTLPKCSGWDRAFRWDGDRQQHIPSLIVEFEPVPFDGPNDAKGWKDRDAFAAMLSAAPELPDVPIVPEGLTAQVRDGIADWIEKNIGHKELWTPEIVDLIRSLECNDKMIFGAISAAPEPAQAEQPRNELVQQERIYQYQLASGDWIDQTRDSYEYNKAGGAKNIRILYTSPQAQPMSNGQLSMFGHRIANELGDVSPNRVQTIARAVERLHKIAR